MGNTLSKNAEKRAEDLVSQWEMATLGVEWPSAKAKLIDMVAECLGATERKALKQAASIADSQSRNTGKLATSPMRSAAAYDIAVQIRKLMRGEE